MTTTITLSSHDIAPPPPAPAAAVRASVPAKPPRGSWQRGRIAARYDAAQTTDQNRNHWAAADALGPDASLNPTVRRITRQRARYEAGNNGYVKRSLRVKRNDLVGTGPRLQLTLPETWTDPDFGTRMTTPEGAARAVERAYRKWAKAAGVARELRVMVESGNRDGECFGLFVTNPAIDDGVKLGLRLLEADQCSTPDLNHADPLATDGVRYDEFGNPVEYHFLKSHPGEPGWPRGWNEYDRVDAKYVVHWFDIDRPGQRRGITQLAPSLNLSGQTRRFTSAVLAAAETAANHAAVLYTDQPPPGDDDPAGEGDRAPEQPEAFDRIPMPQNGGITLPNQWRVEQLKPEQPTTTYPQFKNELLTESGACLNLPRNVSTCSSAEYNYSSARLDHLPTRQDARITRDDLRAVALDPLFRAWLHNARLIPGYLPAGLPPAEEWEWAWQWDGFESIDPVKDATADQIRLANGTTTLSRVLAADGVDIEEHLEQRAKELATAAAKERKYGLPPGSLLPAAATVAAPPPPAPEPDDAEAQDEEAADPAAAPAGP